MNESPLQPEAKNADLSERIGLFVSLSEMSIRQRLRLITCLSKDQHSYRVVGKPTLPSAEIDAIIEACKNSFGSDRKEMCELIGSIVQTREEYEAQHEAHKSGKSIQNDLKAIAKLLWGAVSRKDSPQTEISDRETVSQIAVYQTLETLIRTADLETYEPERIAEISANDPETRKIQRLLAMKV